MAPPTPALSLRDVVKTYGRHRALDGLTVEIPRGVVCGLVGPNGAGKTTTYGVVGGYVRPDSGEISVLGAGPFRTAVHAGHVTLLPQDCELSPHMPVRDLLLHLARLQGLSRREAERDADRVLDLVDLTDRARNRIRQLSHGMRRRVAVAQAFLGDPQLILLDEPTAGLDPSQVVRLRDLFRAQRGKRTLIISSHILSELEAACDHVVLMENGRCVRAGPMSEVTARRALVRIRFAGDLPLDRLRSRLPGATISVDRDELIVTARDATSSADINRLAIPILFSANVEVFEIHRGQSLEAAFLAEQAGAEPPEETDTPAAPSRRARPPRAPVPLAPPPQTTAHTDDGLDEPTVLGSPPPEAFRLSPPLAPADTEEATPAGTAPPDPAEEATVSMMPRESTDEETVLLSPPVPETTDKGPLTLPETEEETAFTDQTEPHR